jgi:ribonuclease HI
VLKIYSDGGARGNPGPAAIAFIAINEQGKVAKTYSRYIGVRTNNQAEYEAVIVALEYAAKAGTEEVKCHLDSELVTRQLRGEYSIKAPELKKLAIKTKELIRLFKKAEFINVPRGNSFIQDADALLNKTLDHEAPTKTTLKVESIGNSPAPSYNEKSDLPVLVHTSIRTSNMERSIDFYSRFLGLKLLSRREIKETNAEIAFLQDPQAKGSILELTFYRTQEKFVQPEYENRLFDHLGFEVHNVNITISDMKKEGVTVTDEPFKLGSNGPVIAFIEDPDGTLIELIQRK